MAGEQTAGRGRGRGAGSWSTNRGNLAVSFVHFPTAPQADWFALSYAAGLALARVLVGRKHVREIALVHVQTQRYERLDRRERRLLDCRP